VKLQSNSAGRGNEALLPEWVAVARADEFHKIEDFGRIEAALTVLRSCKRQAGLDPAGECFAGVPGSLLVLPAPDFTRATVQDDQVDDATFIDNSVPRIRPHCHRYHECSPARASARFIVGSSRRWPRHWRCLLKFCGFALCSIASEALDVLLNLTLPRINEHMITAVVRTIYPRINTALPLGAKLMDLSIDLSTVLPHDCPPISMYRIALRDRVWLRNLAVGVGDEIAVGTTLARFSTEPDESLDGDPARAVRVTIAGIIDPVDWWHEEAR
jgi:hypothetical protein